MKEMKNLEYKESVTNTFLKTVSAYANYNGGEIVFGITDEGKKIGVSNPNDTCLDIENKINDSLTPQPEYTLKVCEADQTITLSVKSGRHKPYLYKSKAYKRNDTATIEVDALELTRLILEGKNMNYEDLPAQIQELTFGMLEEALKQHIAIDNFNTDILKTLNLYSSDEGFNNAAALLADKNEFSIIDVAKFGESISVIQKRATFERVSVLAAYESVVAMYRDYYQYEEIVESHRKKVERVPEAAFREAIANALIHRAWDIRAHIRILMFEDRIEITSPGGLPNGIKEEEYLSGRLSVLRNPTLANVFYRLGIVEIFGTGILRISEVYKNSVKKPNFEVTENSIKVVLPVSETDLNLSNDERKVYELLSKTMSKSISEILPYVEFGKTKVTKLLKNLANEGIVKVEGSGRGTKYRL
ncbi:ATP-binding protein [Anaerosacchariphilus polymeriproducens]|uniref:AAA family ATPase n=1 Tax=Anaerosacchariphilus polymeriproducens TaxID=1812858 RepID=A0A371AR47_9FIRM|nr:ATP-binding protein [Anaerosacchariphilus polymeriproducens]RDU21910.1 AAA family ATPase [Anaerosacchariphilus polymeriproducens]